VLIPDTGKLSLRDRNRSRVEANLGLLVSATHRGFRAWDRLRQLIALLPNVTAGIGETVQAD